jgi:ATP-dependent DNA ligase
MVAHERNSGLRMGVSIGEFGFSPSPLLRRKRSHILYLDHVEGDGWLLFAQIVAMDLEGIVCKQKDSPYKVTERPSRHWIKVKNSRYSATQLRHLKT